jgi:hypothetical protein
MKNLTTPKAILIGLSLIALAIASTPLTSSLVQPAHAQSGVQRVAICALGGLRCADVSALESLQVYASSM